MIEKPISCSGCDELDKMKVWSGGIAGAPTYWMYCNHSDIVAAVAFSDVIPTRSVTQNNNGETLEEQRTPGWCPYLKQEN